MAQTPPTVGSITGTQSTRTIYIVHGWAYSLEKWGAFLDELQKAGYRGEILTVPGLTEKTDHVWTIDDYIDWLDTKLPQEEPNIVLGHSNGGRIVAGYTARFPKKVKALILMGAAGVIHNDVKTQLKRAVFGTAAKIGKLFTKSEVLKKILYRLAREKDYYEASPHMKQTMINMLRVDVLSWLKTIKVPSLLVWGALDRSTPTEDGQKMHRALVNSELIVLQEARHAPHSTHPQKTVDTIVKFLAKKGL